MVRVYAPASIGNVSVGYDLLGAAVSPVDGSLLGDVVTIESQAQDEFQLSCSGPFAAKLPANGKDNIVYQCCEYFRAVLLKQGRENVPFLTLHLEKNLPVGSGLGSSATSVVAAFEALNEYFDRPFDKVTLLEMMGKFEGQLSGSVHYDNVAPCYLGGIQLMTADDDICQSIPVCDDWFWVMGYSGISVSTKMARDVLPNQVDLATAISYGRHLAAFIDASHKGDWSKAAAQIKDVIAEPHRSHLLPNFAHVVAELKAMGAQACGISGSGPTIFAIATSLEQAEQFKQYITEHYIQNEQGFCRVCSIDQQGARVLPSKEG